MATDTAAQPGSSTNDRLLFWACFISLIATAFGFIIRAFILDEWAVQFGLSETQKGEILGVGLWPFAVSIVLFSLIIDRIGYGKAMVFAFICHLGSAIITVTATDYWGLYIGTLIAALGNGTVEAVINPVVATMFSKEKTKWLNILHAGWPGGLVLGGLLALAMGADVDWRYKVGLIAIPTVLYGILMLGRKFPVSERVAAGVSYKEMLQEAGIIGALIVVALMVREVGRVFGLGDYVQLGIIAVVTAAYGAYVQALGRPLFIALLIVMIPLATTELGTDSWITDLMTPEMEALDFQPGWVLVYTSLIMMVLRFFAGPIVHSFSPLGLLAASAAIAAVGLVWLSSATGTIILFAATLYGFGKTFFWPTMLGVVAERFPKGGALTLNAIAGVGMLGVGVVGSAFLGNIQDKAIDAKLEDEHPELHAEVIGEEMNSAFGSYRSLDTTKTYPIIDSVALYEKEQELDGKDADEDDAYRRLVQVAYDHTREEGDTDEVEYDAMKSALADKNLLLDEDSFEAQKEKKENLEAVTGSAKKGALKIVAIFPVFMLVCYLAMIAYFRSQGGYKAESLDEGGSDAAPEGGS